MSRSRPPFNLKPYNTLLDPFRYAIAGAGVITALTGAFMLYNAAAIVKDPPRGTGGLGDGLIGFFTMGMIGGLVTTGSLVTYSGCHVAHASLKGRPTRPIETFITQCCFSAYGLFGTYKGLQHLNKYLEPTTVGPQQNKNK